MKFILKACLFFFAFYLCAFSQSSPSKIFHPLSNALGITFEAGATLSKTDYKIDELNISGRLLLEYFFTSRTLHAFGLRVMGSGGFLEGDFFSNDLTYPPVSDNFRTGFFSFGGGLVYTIRLSNTLPYLSINTAYMIFDPRDTNGNQLPNNKYYIYNKGVMLYSGEAGIRFPFSNVWSLNLGTSINLSNTDYLDDVAAGDNYDAFINCFVGLSFYLGKNIDNDNDGVDDDIDFCPDTQEGSKVDEFGCSQDDIISQTTSYDNSRDEFISEGIFTDGKSFCFQVDFLSDLKEAKLMQRKIVYLGYKADIFTINTGTLNQYSVRIGYFKSFEIARLYREDFFRKTNFKLR